MSSEVNKRADHKPGTSDERLVTLADCNNVAVDMTAEPSQDA